MKLDRDWLEEWRPTPEAPGYEASSFGRIRDAATGKLLRQIENRNGYLIVSVKLEGKWTSRQVGACVCAAFHGPRPEGQVADHRNRKPQVNQPWNLQWLGAKLNKQLAIHKQGADRYAAKLTAAQVADIRRLYRRHDRSGHASGRALAEYYGVSTPTIISIIQGRTWNEERAEERLRRREKFK